MFHTLIGIPGKLIVSHYYFRIVINEDGNCCFAILIILITFLIFTPFCKYTYFLSVCKFPLFGKDKARQDSVRDE